MLKQSCRVVCLACWLSMCAAAWAQTPPETKTEAQLDEEAKQADALYQNQQLFQALPLYEDLHARRPQRTFYTERLAMAWIAKGGTESTPEATAADNQHALELFKQAHAAGDNSDLAQIMLEKLTAAANASPAASGPLPEWRVSFNQAKQFFSKGDLKAAIGLYEKSWRQNPQFYSAPLFAGDAEFKMGHYDEASVWFARAIAIDPDVETAHRYWADSLYKQGKTSEAHRQYVEAFIAEPYVKAPRLDLRTWAQTNQMRYVPPPIMLPSGPTTGKDGHINITIDGSATPNASAMALAYSMNATVWQMKTFKETYPDAKAYRHTLKEEVAGMKAMLEVIHRQKAPEDKLDPTSRSLLLLEKDNMLECWVLLDNPDQGTAQDYATYRAQHRDLLKAYVEKYDLHPA